MMDDPLFTVLARKMSISSREIIQKASEFLRVVDVRCGSASLASLNLSGSCKAVVCLEIAALSCGLSISKAVAVKTSGMPQKLYANAYKAIECILGQQKQMSIRDLAVLFGCVSSATLAEKVLKRYHESYNGITDFNQSIFAASSLYVVCRSQKVRIDKTKLINHLNVKRTMFDKLCKQMLAILDKISDKAKDTHSKRPYSWLEESSVQQDTDVPQMKKTRVTETDQKEKSEADYEAWKLKILTAAKNKTTDNR